MMNTYRMYMIPYLRFRNRHPKWFSEYSQYHYARYMIDLMKRTGRIDTETFGTENLPKKGGYVMYPNHQGKYDALGIMYAHDDPCCIVMDEKRSHMPLVTEFLDLVGGKRMDISDARQAVALFREISAELKERSKKFIIFPEGGYDKNGNTVFDFKPGAFKAAMMARVPIVPVALVDSYKVFQGFSLRRVTTQVHFLKPLYYEQYSSMSTREIAAEVRNIIENKIEEKMQEKISEAV